MYSPKGGTSGGGPGPNALAPPQQLQTAPLMRSQNSLAQAPNLGSGLAQGAMDIKSQYPVWQQQYLEGGTTLQFPEWLKGQQGQGNPAMPAGNQMADDQQSMMNKSGYGPRGY